MLAMPSGVPKLWPERRCHKWLCPGCRYTNVQLINTIGVAEQDKRECLECWCKDKKDHGSFFCCKNCPAKDGPAVNYHLEYTVTYRYICTSSIGFCVTRL